MTSLFDLIPDPPPPHLAEDICARRHHGSPESIDAFERARPTIAAMQRCVLDVIRLAGARGLTAKEVARALERPLNAISGRVSELKAVGLVRKTGERRDGSAVLVTV